MQFITNHGHKNKIKQTFYKVSSHCCR